MLRYLPFSILLGMLVMGCQSAAPIERIEIPNERADHLSTHEKQTTIAFAVKAPTEPWFQREMDAATQASKEDGFRLIPVDVSDPSKVLAQMDAVAANGAQGLIICAPNVHDGLAIVKRAELRNLKLMTVDDQLTDSTGHSLDIPYVGINAPKVGRLAGETIWKEVKKRKWNMAETRVVVLSQDLLKTAKQRTDAALAVLTENGVKPSIVFQSTIASADIPSGLDAASKYVAHRPLVRNWILIGPNDSVVIGGVRATEKAGIGPSRVIGIGINGDSALYDLKKPGKSGLFGSILLQAKVHGHDTAHAMYRWIKNKIPPADTTLTNGVVLTKDNFKAVLFANGISS